MTQTRKVLIIEDNLDDLELCQRALKKCDDVFYELIHAKTGDRGIQALQEGVPDCVLLDYSLPKNDGMVVLRQIREQYPHLPVVILTGQGTDTLAAQFIKAGAFEYITKASINTETLSKIIKGAIAQGADLLQRQNNSTLMIMVVDDNPDDRERCIRSLKKMPNLDFCYREVSGGDTMFEALAKYELPDCILLDYSLPGRNGLELLKTLTTQYPSLPVVMMTGQGNERIAVQAIKDGAQNYVVKNDIAPESLSKSISAAISNANLERKLAEKELELRNAKAFLELINDNNPELVLVKDEQFRVVEANRAAKTTYPGELIGSNGGAEYLKETKDWEFAKDQEAFEKGYSEGFEELFLPGEKKRVLFTKRIRFEDASGKPFLLEIARDVTEREREQNFLQEIYQITSSSGLDSAAKMQKILDAGCHYFGLSLGIISKIVGDQYQVTHVSQNDSLNAGDVFSLGETYCSLTYSQDTPFASHNFGCSPNNNHPCYDKFKLESYIGVKLYLNSTPYGTLNFSATEARRHPFSDREKAFIKLAAQWIEFELARDQLIDHLTNSNEELERFAFVCSHDLKEPLRVIHGFSERLQEHLGTTLEEDEKGKMYFKFIMDGAERAQKLIADILAYSSIDSNTLPFERIETQDLISTIKENMLLQLEECGGKISHDVLPKVFGNKTQLFQLFQNLINNGIKYQKSGADPHVHIGVENKERHWLFSVQDNGIGMEEQYLNKIFEVFQRLHGRTEYPGTGVGLSICKKVVERHGGKIWVESKKDVGSTFYFTILRS